MSFLVFVAAALSALVLSPAAANDLAAVVYDAAVAEDDASPDTPAALVAEYFRTDDASHRAKIASRIDSASQGDWRLVATVVRQLQLWPALPELSGTFVVDSTSPDPAPVTFELPPDYDPTRRYPVIVCFPSGSLPRPAVIQLARRALRGAADGFVLLAVDRRATCGFLMPPNIRGNLAAVLRQARQLIHMDTDRVFAFGISQGADSAWLAGILHPDLFAGVMVIDGYPRVPYPEQTYSLILENLGHVPVLMGWQNDEDAPTSARRERVNAHCTFIANQALRRSLPITARSAPPAQDPGRNPRLPFSAKEARTFLAGSRRAHAREVSHWFRYPEHGRAGWLRRTKCRNPVWEAEQLSILPSTGADYDEFVTEVVKSKLFYIGGRIAGQVITIDTRRCDGIEVLLGEEDVGFDKPVTIICNGRRRRDGILKPSVATLLETAYEEWEFQRLSPVRLSFSVKTDMKDEG